MFDDKEVVVKKNWKYKREGRHTYIEYRGPKKAEGMDRMYIVTWLSLNNLYTQPFLHIFSILSPSVAFLTMLSAVSLVKEKKPLILL